MGRSTRPEGTAILRRGRDGRRSRLKKLRRKVRCGVDKTERSQGQARFCGLSRRTYSYPERNKKSLEGFKEESGSVILAC